MNKNKAKFNNNLSRSEIPNVFSSGVKPPNEAARIARRLKKLREGKNPHR